MAFMEWVKTDPGLQAKLKASNSPEVVMGLAKELGFTLSIDDLSANDSNLTAEELEGLSGGRSCSATCLCRPSIQEGEVGYH